MLEFQDYYLLRELNSLFPDLITFQNGKAIINEAMPQFNADQWAQNMSQAGMDVNQPTTWQQNMANAGFAGVNKTPASPECVTVLRILNKLSPNLKQAIQKVLSKHGCPTQSVKDVPVQIP